MKTLSAVGLWMLLPHVRCFFAARSARPPTRLRDFWNVNEGTVGYPPSNGHSQPPRNGQSIYPPRNNGHHVGSASAFPRREPDPYTTSYSNNYNRAPGAFRVPPRPNGHADPGPVFPPNNFPPNNGSEDPGPTFPPHNNNGFTSYSQTHEDNDWVVVEQSNTRVFYNQPKTPHTEPPMKRADALPAQPDNETDNSIPVEVVSESPRSRPLPPAGTPLASTNPHRLLEAVQNGRLTDVELIGEDGIPVPASRFVLGANSRILEHLCSTHPNQPISIPGCPARVLQLLVEYCCSGALDSWHPQGQQTPPDLDLRQALQLLTLGHMYEMPELADLATLHASHLVQRHPHLACLVFGTPLCPAPLQRTAARRILTDPQTTLFTNGAGLSLLGPHPLESMFRACFVQPGRDALALDVLLFWRKLHGNNDDLCQRLARYINLASIPPELLTSKALPSGLWDDTALLHAFRIQALRMARMHPETHALHTELWVTGAGVEHVNGLYLRTEDGTAYEHVQGHARITTMRGSPKLLQEGNSIYYMAQHEGNVACWEDDTWQVERDGVEPVPQFFQPSVPSGPRPPLPTQRRPPLATNEDPHNAGPTRPYIHSSHRTG